MELQYRYSESTIRPEEFEVTDDTIYIRKNIVRMTSNNGVDGDNPINYWEYYEAAIPKNIFKNNTGSFIFNEQKANTDNQLIIMEALSDLYAELFNIQDAVAVIQETIGNISPSSSSSES